MSRRKSRFVLAPNKVIFARRFSPMAIRSGRFLVKPAVGLIGLGLMGKPMGANLLKAGFPLTVWNRTRAKTEDLARQGAKVAGSPREAAASSDVLLTIVSDPPALEEILWGASGALEGLRRWRPRGFPRARAGRLRW